MVSDAVTQFEQCNRAFDAAAMAFERERHSISCLTVAFQNLKQAAPAAVATDPALQRVLADAINRMRAYRQSHGNSSAPVPPPKSAEPNTQEAEVFWEEIVLLLVRVNRFNIEVSTLFDFAARQRFFAQHFDGTVKEINVIDALAKKHPLAYARQVHMGLIIERFHRTNQEFIEECNNRAFANEDERAKAATIKSNIGSIGAVCLLILLIGKLLAWVLITTSIIITTVVFIGILLILLALAFNESA